MTSRNQLAGLVAAEGARPIGVDLLTAAEARRAAGPPARRRPVGGRTAGGGRDHRAVRAAAAGAGRASPPARPAHPGVPPGRPRRRTAGRRRGRLDAFDGGDAGTDVRAVFSWSYRSLSPPAARLFRLLGLHPGPDIGVAAAASLAGLPRGQVRRLLAELARAPPGHRARARPVRAARPAAGVRGRAGRELDTDAGPARGGPARRWTTTCTPRTRPRCCCNPGRDPVAARPPPRPAWCPRSSPTTARRWPGSPPSTRCCWRRSTHARRAGFDGHAWQLAWTLVDFLHRRGHWHGPGRHPADRAGRGAAGGRPTRAGERPPRPRPGARPAGSARTRRADTTAAALELFGELGDHTGQARTHRAFGAMLDGLGRHAEALRPRAAGPGRCTGPPATWPGEASACNAVGWAHAQLGEYGPALDALPAGAGAAAADRRPARRGEHLGQPRLHPRPARPATGGDPLLPPGARAVPARSATDTTRRTP